MSPAIVLVGRHGVGTEDLGLHHLGESEDGVERRAQLVAHLGEEARLGDVGRFRAAARLVGDRLGGFELADQRVLLGARLERGELGRIEPVGQQREIALRGDRQDRQDVVLDACRGTRSRARPPRVTGAVAAIIAIGTLADSVEDSATTSSMMNSMKVPVFSSTPTGWIRMNIQARPQNRSSMMKRIRQARLVDRRLRLGQELPALGDDDGVDDQHRAGPGAGGDRADPQARQEADHADQQQDHQRRRQPVLREQPQQLVVEERPRPGGRGQPVARLAHVLRGRAAALGRRPVGGKVALVATHTHDLLVLRPLQPVQNSRKILKTTLKSGLKTAVNDRFLASTAWHEIRQELCGMRRRSMKLYDGGRAPNPRRVRVFLAEKGIIGAARAGRSRRARAEVASLHGHQPDPAGAGAGARRRHDHCGIDRDLPLFRGAASGAAAVRAGRAGEGD